MICTNCQRELADYSNFCYFCGARQHFSPGVSPRAQKRLMRSSVDRKIAGVCGGIAEYLEIDPTIVRLLWVVMTLIPVPVVPSIVAYLVAWLIMPEAPLPVEPSIQAAPPAGAAHSPTAS